MIAAAAHVTGAVNLDVIIGNDGRVARAVSMGGPPMLEMAAAEGVRAWVFEPVTGPGGSPVVARTVVTVLFGPTPTSSSIDSLLAYGDALLRCSTSLESGQFHEDASRV